MLEVNNIEVGYDQVQVLFGVSIEAHAGELLCLLGRNGAGKTTVLKSIMGLLPLKSGSINFNDENINDIAAQEVPKRGIAYVPQGRRLFSELTVAQNIEIGLMAATSRTTSTRNTSNNTREKVLAMFPRLQERLKQRAETLSGGEQQMLAMARALSMEPALLLLDEPTEGLQPSIIKLIQDSIVEMKKNGVGIILVEHHIETALSIADHIAFMENGRCPETLSVAELRQSPQKITEYLGVN